MTNETTDGLRPERYRSYLLMLARVGLRSCGPAANKIDASDIVQDVLLQAHVARDQFRGSTEAELEAWLRKILKNKLTDGVRRFGRQKRDAALERSIRSSVDGSVRRMQRLVDPGTSPSQRVWRLERAVRLTQALQTLPEDQQIALELHHVQGYSVSEIAQQLDRTKASVAGLLRRGLAQLREGLKDLE